MKRSWSWRDSSIDDDDDDDDVITISIRMAKNFLLRFIRFSLFFVVVWDGKKVVEEGGGKIVYFLDILQHSLFPFYFYRVFNNMTIDFFLSFFLWGFTKLNKKFNNFCAHVCEENPLRHSIIKSNHISKILRKDDTKKSSRWRKQKKCLIDRARVS